jgi:hypothetical protein
MAVARSSVALVSSRDADLAEIERWYRDLLADTPPPADLEWEPVRIGPTWQWSDEAGWLLPDATLGWGFLAWCGYWLTGKAGRPWRFTPEQARFWLWYFAIDTSGDTGDFLYHSAMLQRLKGWGKDPMAATAAAGSLHAPIVFDRWAGDRPVGRDEPDAWTQILAVSLEQTKNTMKLFPGLISEEARRYYGIQIGKENVWSDGDRRQIQAVTSSPLAIEGGRPKLIVRNETQNWVSSNGGHDMTMAIEGNAAKAEMGAPARILDIFNAFRPGRDSVAERARTGWEETQGADAIRMEYGVLLDSLEAPPGAPLTPAAAPSVVRAIAGDSTWLDTRPGGRIVKSILNPSNSASESRRKWYNQITGTEDAWVDPRWVDLCARPGETLADGEQILVFGDGSKSDDATGLVACRFSDGFLFTLHHQQPSKDELVSRAAVDAAVVDMFDRYRPLGFWFDPSHAKADDAVDDDRFWWPLVDRWHAEYGKRLNRLWAVKSGTAKHAVAFDMLKPSAQQLFQPAVTQLAEDLEAGTALHHGGARLVQHMKNARRRDGRYGMSVGKESRSSARKIDLAVCAIGARLMRRQLLLADKKPGSPGQGRAVALD